MKLPFKIIAVLALLCGATIPATATLWCEDGITGAVGSRLGVVAPFFGSTSKITITNLNLTYPLLADPMNMGNRILLGSGNAGSTFRPIDAVATNVITSDSVYYSFLLECTNLPTAENYLASLVTNAVNPQITGSGDPLSIYFKNSGSGYVLGLRKYGVAITYAGTSTVLSQNTTNLIVAKYTFNGGSGDDTVTLYINPTPGGLESGATPEVSFSGGNDVNPANGIAFLGWKAQSSTAAGAWLIDSLRVASTWAEVIPSSAAAPHIDNDQTNQTALLGQDVTFSVQVSGTPPLNYQWYYNTNTPLSGSTNSTLSLTNVQLADAGGYSVIVTNAYGSATSVVAQLTVNALSPSIDLDPQAETVLVGQDASFNVQASGTAPLSYQWYFNTNTPISDATNSALTIAGAQLTNAGAYSVVVTNPYGSATSAVAQLTVNTPVAPSITMQPQDQTNVLPGATATFSVIAGGSEPLSYQWYFNTNTPIANGTAPILTILNVQPANAGSYSVTVSNTAGGVVSSYAFLTVNTNPVAPVFNSQPASQVVLAGSTVSFTAVAAGTAPISYQWNKNGTPISGATSSTLTLTNVQASDSASYTVTAANSAGSTNSTAAVLTVSTTVNVANSAYNLVGFGRATTGGGVIAETNSAYRKCYTAYEFVKAIYDSTKTVGAVRVIEVMNDLDLGYNEVDAATRAIGAFRAHATPKLHPKLIVTGVSLIDIQTKGGGLTIFSANGATIRHTCLNIKSTANIIVRNLKFDEMWEWDESSKGNYDGNDWDFIDIGNGGGVVSNIWIDHCTFTKAYDGISDIKGGAYNITFSWNKYVGDDGATNPNSMVWQQINKLESNKTAYAMYNSLRTYSGFSTTNIVTIIQGHDKTHLMGANSLDAENARLSATFHHQWFQNCWDRVVPRLRAGSVHNFNIIVDDTVALAAKRLRDSHTVSSSYSFNPFLNGTISTENGAILVEKSIYKDCLTPLRNNQTDPNNPVYTGKIKALDTIYQFDSTVVRGNSTDPGNPLGPFQATIIPFSWNTNAATPGGQLPYTYTMDDPSQLQAILSSPTVGAGAGVLTWAKTNWLMTSYLDSAPTIVTALQDQTVTVGNNATFTVVAGGTSPFSYQWYFNTNTPLVNQTNANLTLNNVQTNDAGKYHVVVTNTVGSVTSSLATLTVNLPSPVPSITTQPVNQTVTVGQSASFTVLAAGTAPLSYQWYFNTNTALANQTNATLTLNNVQTTNAGKYSVVVTNAYGSATSSLAQLTVNLPVAPSITTQPTNQTVIVGQSAVFTVVAGGDSPLSYQWYFNTNTALAGKTGTTLTFTNVQTSNAGAYQVVVTNIGGAVTSEVATLTVNQLFTNPPPALLAYEPFTNAPGTAIIGSSDGFGFAGPWQDYSSSAGTATNTSYGLSYTDGSGNALVTSGGAGFFQGLIGVNTSMQPIRPFAFARGTNGVDGTVTWISFLAVRQGPTVGGLNPYPRGANVDQDITSGNLQKLAIGNSSGASNNTVALIPQGSSSNIKPSTSSFAQTNFVVVRINHNLGTNLDEVYLFINPPLDTEPSLGSADTNSVGSFDFSFDRLRVFAGGDNSPSQPYAELVVDEYRVGQTYADVSPYTSGSPTTSPPRIIQGMMLPDGNTSLTITGTAGLTYRLWAGTNLTQPRTNYWTVLTGGTFSNAPVTFTDLGATNYPSRFYRTTIP